MGIRLRYLITCLLLGCGSSPQPRVEAPTEPQEEPEYVLVPTGLPPITRVEWAGDFLVVANREHRYSSSVFVLDATTLEVLGAQPSMGTFAVAGDFVVLSWGVWDLRNDVVRPLEPADTEHMAVSPDKRTVARTVGRSVRLIDVRRGREVGFLDSDNPIRGLEFGGELLAVTYQRGAVVYTLEGEPLYELPHGVPVLFHGDPPRWVQLDEYAFSAYDVETGERLVQNLHEFDWLNEVRHQLDPTRVLGFGFDREEMNRVWVGFEMSDGETTDPIFTLGNDRSLELLEGCGLVWSDEEHTVELADQVSVGRYERPCSEVVFDSTRRRAAYAHLDRLFTFDATNGQALVSSTTGELTDCNRVETTDLAVVLEHGFVAGRSVQGCEPLEGPCARLSDNDALVLCADEDDAERTGNEDVIGRSANQRFRLVGRADNNDDYDGAGYTGRVVLEEIVSDSEVRNRGPIGELRVYCDLFRDELEEGGWYSYYLCGGAASVSNDGATVYFGDANGFIQVDVDSGQSTPIPFGPRHGRRELQLVTESVLLLRVSSVTGGNHHVSLRHLPTGRSIDGQRALLTPDERYAIVTAPGRVEVVDTTDFTVRTVEYSTNAERESWTLTRDGSTLIRNSLPLLRVDVATARLHEPVELPPGVLPEASNASDDGMFLQACIANRRHVLDLSDGSSQEITPDCDVETDWLLNDVLVIRRGIELELHRMRDGARLPMFVLHVGRRRVWIARQDGRFWAPSAALSGLSVRAKGDLTNRRTPLAESDAYDADLLRNFVEH